MDWLPSVSTSAATLLVGLAGGVFLYLRTRVERTPNATDLRAADAAANGLILKLLEHANRQVDRSAEVIRGLREDLAARPSVGLARVLDDAQVGHEQAIVERDRLVLAISHLRDKARRSGTLSSSEVIVWSNNALDLSVPLLDLLDLPDDAIAAIESMEKEK